MAQKQGQIQEQKQEQRLQQSVSQLQFLQSQLVELPIQQFAERIQTEMHDNPALETTAEDPDYPEYTDYSESSDNSESSENSESSDDFDNEREREERIDALDAALQNMGRDDEDLPVYHGGQSSADDREEMVYGQAKSFYDILLEQVGELELNDQERFVMEYLIRSLDDDGLLRVSLESIADELAIYHHIDLTTTQIEAVLKQLQHLDPAGIGARTLQECLLLQIDRKMENPESGIRHSELTLMRRVITDYFDAFTKKHWDKIGQSLSLTAMQSEALFSELRRLNPKPGAAMGESVGRSMQQITPDFIVDTHDDGSVTFTLNNGEIPQLQVSQSFADLLKEYQTNKDGLSRQMKEALLYTKQKVDAAQNFIEAVQMRRRTMTLTMQAIIHLQHRFFEDGDESLLRPMILKDVAEYTGLDLSTVSRVSNSKYVQTRWGIFPLKYFFSDGYVTDGGEELSTREIKAALRDLIEGEDKHKPMSDDALSEALKQKGYPIARRTVAKYREQLGFPVARLRK
jgi:RNA polymerase sigma-54 factor